MFISAQQWADTAKIETLLDCVFGKERISKSSYSLRRNIEPVRGLSYVFRNREEILGTIRFWPVFLQDFMTGSMDKVLLLGPLAVCSTLQGQGVGTALIRKGLTAARFQGYHRIVLVGDKDYYARFGFKPVEPNRVKMPNGEDAERLLYLDLRQASDLPELGALVPYAPLESGGQETADCHQKGKWPFARLAS
ncbi:N-acetyltransferase [Temperatibacter marinus]|uniref:N-acetyltransferase n=1 Tax=Temperatibacter marinus TaxID=1456591 RepID=A0AA52EG79_9PROT|nr:N-acetyltransferase [Temperatibacter marinus]WND01962.1 N-acetyltransferase [Temperatibacter marinus]